MADHHITPDQQGAYEIPLTADNAVTVQIDATGTFNYAPQAHITFHRGTSPLYVAIGNTVAVADPTAKQLDPYTMYDLPIPAADTVTLALISHTDGTASVSRS